TARLWDARTGEQQGQFVGHSGAVNSAAFSLDGERVVTASDDHTARVWSVKTSAQQDAPLHHRSRVQHAAFTADGA
ncbi:MAG: hypothetical protein KC468_29975, partial [Myxococcales bacterium]|nr:hypothetical protein [Myxococcales bacterium]